MYHWMKKKDSKEFLSYLEEENQYAKKRLKPLEGLKKKLFEEMKSRLPLKNRTEPVPYGLWLYYEDYEKEKPYPVYKRRKKEEGDDKEEILLDANQMGKKGAYLDISNLGVSTNHEILSYAIDTKGREFYDIRFKNLKTGEPFKHFISSATSEYEWASDNKTLFYVRQDKNTLRAFQVWRFDLETGKEEKVYEEKDDKFSVMLYKSLCGGWIFLLSASSQTTELRILKASDPKTKFQLFSKRVFKHEYYLTHSQGVFYILSNKDEAFNFKIMKASQKDFSKKEELCPTSQWKELIPHRENIFISNFLAFKDQMVLSIREGGLPSVEILDLKSEDLHKVNFPQVGLVSVGDNEEFDSPFVRLEFESLATPETIYDYEFKKRKLHFKSQIPVPNFNSKDYVCERLEALSHDGVKIPLSLVYKKGLKRPAPLLLYGYGSYGISMDLYFRSPVISLLDRGFVYVIAHIRGGSEKGIKWYEEAKFLKKKNTFFDFISSAKFLVDKGYTSPDNLYIMGGSAGGLLMGACLNEAPHLFKGAVASVPFVDVLSTMLDPTIPLSTGEYEEWGNPNEKAYHDYMLSYSPYDNVKEEKYPHLLVETGYHDPRVQCFEPAKWVAKLRDKKTNDSELLFITNMKSGHFGATGRLERLKLTSLYYSFFVGIEGLLGH